MPTGRREQVFAAVLARFGAINGTGNYNYNLTGKVSAWRHLGKDPWLPAELPAVTVTDPLRRTEQQLSGVQTHDLEIHVLGAVAGTGSPAAARKLIDDLVEAIRSDRTWGGLAWDTRPGSDDIALEQEGDRIAHVRLIFTVQYRTKSFDPYNAQ